MADKQNKSDGNAIQGYDDEETKPHRPELRRDTGAGGGQLTYDKSRKQRTNYQKLEEDSDEENQTNDESSQGAPASSPHK